MPSATILDVVVNVDTREAQRKIKKLCAQADQFNPGDWRPDSESISANLVSRLDLSGLAVASLVAAGTTRPISRRSLLFPWRR